ncbi:TetR/AcrR family transcriptional regulator [uncultured Friedmanniella sp.]|uniref:TetR/AcrR family transcriptional regulator n=1 Tax=uncultured Friedmanniella sp. TaxID=335381 RepID=UPI0035CACADC
MTIAPTPSTPPSTRSDPAGARSRNRRGEGGLLRQPILDAALALLDETGDEQAVTLRAVARRVGISAPSIYAHFADRQAILLALVRDAFADLGRALEAADAAAGPDPVRRLRATCTAYLDFATGRPQRYRMLFGGLWNAGDAVHEGAITVSDASQLGHEVLAVLVGALTDCVAAGRSTSSDPAADAVAIWLALHGLAHQRALATAFPWPADLEDRLVVPLAHLVAD